MCVCKGSSKELGKGVGKKIRKEQVKKVRKRGKKPGQESLLEQYIGTTQVYNDEK